MTVFLAELNYEAAVERRGNKLKGLKDFHLKHGPRQGQHLALTVVYAPESGLDCLICADFTR